ncbi:MAG TPA: nuclear transport factor 2 family protein, partial [Gemmatimonadaceae bacterium]|nr:nuclear transport factor 2 family protein [Gemmatimonadaceae bacterium]
MRRLIMLATVAITGLGACAQHAVVVPEPLASTVAADNVEERAVMDAERAWVNAAIAGDPDAFGRFMADEYVAQGPKGTLLTKAAWVQR